MCLPSRTVEIRGLCVYISHFSWLLVQDSYLKGAWFIFLFLS